MTTPDTITEVKTNPGIRTRYLGAAVSGTSSCRQRATGGITLISANQPRLTNTGSVDRFVLKLRKIRNISLNKASRA